MHQAIFINKSWEGGVTDQMAVNLRIAIYQSNHTILRSNPKGLILGRNQREIGVIWIVKDKTCGTLLVATDLRTEIINRVGLVIISWNINRIIIKLRRIIPVKNANIIHTNLITILRTSLIQDFNLRYCNKHVN
jgi:hypothetical protein